MLSKRSLSAEVSEFSAKFSDNLCSASVLIQIRGNKTARFYAKSIFGDIAEGLSWDLRGDRPGKWTDEQMFLWLIRCCSDDMLFTIICYLLYLWIPDNYSSSRETYQLLSFKSFSHFKKTLCWNQGCWLLRRAGCRAGFLLATEIFPFSKSLWSWSSGKVVMTKPHWTDLWRKKLKDPLGAHSFLGVKMGWIPICG